LGEVLKVLDFGIAKASQEGETTDLLLACLRPERPTPRRCGARVSERFARLCARALALAPQDRHANAGELLAALAALADRASARQC
jgi:hypothetical protein